MEADDYDVDTLKEFNEIQCDVLYELNRFFILRRNLCAILKENGFYIPLPERYSQYVNKVNSMNNAFKDKRIFIVFIGRNHPKSYSNVNESFNTNPPTLDIITVHKHFSK